MGSKWRKAKQALGLNLCYYVPKTVEDEDEAPSSEQFSDAALLSHRAAVKDDWSGFSPRPSTPPVPAVFSAARFKLLRSSSRSSSQKGCSICLAAMKPGEGHAIFTAECSHSFHFHCITSNVKHGNQICPICRAKWKEIPLKSPIHHPGQESFVHRIPPPRPSRHILPPYQITEPAIFNDDESLGKFDHTLRTTSNLSTANPDPLKTIDIKTYPEVSSIQRNKSRDNFTVLIHLKAAIIIALQGVPFISGSTRTPVDLVTVLDISGSMAGTKLALLKRAMGFVIQNLGPNDRLSVIAFSSTARRLFPLLRMSETGRQQALHAVNSLIANGGTNIAEGLRKGAKVMEERREKNSVASIILLSDGRDTYTGFNGTGQTNKQDYQLLLPLSIQGTKNRSGHQIPVHTFGFGTDHDASLMHSISETSGGTFSFIEAEAAIQDAFAQCIGGLLSVIVQELRVEFECVDPNTRVVSINAGSYPSHVQDDGRSGFIEVGDLYADEKRDFLLSLNVPPETQETTSLMKVRCVFRKPSTKELVTYEGQDVTIRRPETLTEEEGVSIEVDRQRNRLKAAEAMQQARASAEQGDLATAISVLENCRKILQSTESAKNHDPLCMALASELKETQERMRTRHLYEASGRAYILSGLSSHSWQRATVRGDSFDKSSFERPYQTPSMVEMLSRSQATIWSFASPKPR